MSGKVAEVLARLLRDLHADRSAYARLRELLEAQFQAALRHRSEQLAALAADIVTLVEALDQRRAVRSELLLALLGRNSKPSVEALLQRLSGGSAQTLTAAWQGLEQQVIECKALNLRNCQLITDQHALMQRVLGVEEATYAEC